MDWLEHWWALFPGRRRDPRRLAQGRAFHRSGRVTNVRVSSGRLSGNVQGSRATPYLVEVLLPSLDDEQWEQVITVTSEQLRFSAQLLAGQLPAGLAEELERRHGIALFGRADRLDPRCPCGQAGTGCAHLAALWEAAAERFARDPYELLRLRGRGRESLLAHLAAHRRRRRGAEDLDTVPIADVEIADWEGAPEAATELRVPAPAPPATPAGPLRLLGDPPGWAGGVSSADLFAPLVVGAADAAKQLRSAAQAAKR